MERQPEALRQAVIIARGQARRFALRCGGRIDEDELLLVGLEGLVRAVDYHHRRYPKEPIEPFMINSVRWAMTSVLRRAARRRLDPHRLALGDAHHVHYDGSRVSPRISSREVGACDNETAPGDVLEHTVDGEPSPEEHAAYSQMCTRVRQAVSGLPVRAREIVRRYYFEEESLTSIGASLGLDRSRASRAHRRARVALAAVLADLAADLGLVPSEGGVS